MQAISINILPAANIVDQAGEPNSAGQGIRVSSAPQTNERDALFTSILQQGITLNAAGLLNTSTGLLPAGAVQGNATVPSAEDTDKKVNDGALDVCNLLIQLMVLSASPVQTPTGAVEDTGGKAGVLTGVTNITPYLTQLNTDAQVAGQINNSAASAPLQGNEASIAEALIQLAAPDSPAAAKNGQQTPSAVQNGAVTATLMSSIQNSMMQSASDGVPAQSAATDTAQFYEMTQVNVSDENDGILPAVGAPKNDQQTVGRVPGEKKGIGAAAISNTGNTAGTPDGLKASSAAGKSESGLGTGAHEKNKSEGGDITGTLTEQALGSTAFKQGTIAEKTAAVEKAMDRFAEDLKSMQGGAQEIKIVLEPESLGILTISVMKTESGISAKIKSEDKDVVAAISDHLQRLISTMENKGIRLNDVDVVYTQAEPNTGFGQHGFTRGGDETPNRYTPVFGKNQEDDASGSDLWQGFYTSDTSSDSTVDYRV